MFRKLKVALGAGSATVDTVLSTGAVRPGDRVQGVVHVGGGEIEQEIEPVTVALQTVVEVESGDSEWASTQTFASTHVADGLVLHPGDARARCAAPRSRSSRRSSSTRAAASTSSR